MKIGDLTVEVRTATLARVGQIQPEELDIEVVDDFNNVGTWRIKVPTDHRLASYLRTPGCGIIVTAPEDVLFSGPITGIQTEATSSDPEGTLIVSGVTDSVLLMDSLAYADPSNYNVANGRPFPWSLTALEDKRTGKVETLMHQFVNANIGPGAPSGRRTGLLGYVTMGANGARGATVTKSAKYDQLGKILSELASVASLGFRIVQRGGSLVFETYGVRDQTDMIRLDIFNSTLAGHKVIVSPPGATRVLVQGKDLVDKVTAPNLAQFPPIRNFVVSTTATSLTAEAEWGRRIESFKDDSSQELRAELEQSGLEELEREGFTRLAVQAVPMEDSSMPYGPAWRMGDRVAVVVEGQELASIVSGYALKANGDGVRLGATIGDPSGFNRARGVVSRINRLDTRLRSMETKVAAQAATAAVQAAQATEQLSALPVRMACGKASITPTTANVTTGLVVALPAGRFTAAPVVTITADESRPQVVNVSVTGASTTSFNLWINKTDTTTTFVHWVAVQPF